MHMRLRRTPTANDRFKGELATWTWRAIGLAAVLHFGAFAFWPTMSAADVSYDDQTAHVVTLPEVPPVPPAR